MQEIIDKWKLNKGVLASKTGMLTGTFCNKLNPKHPTQFTEQEVIRLKMVLKDLCSDLEGCSQIEFNDALKQM